MCFAYAVHWTRYGARADASCALARAVAAESVQYMVRCLYDTVYNIYYP